MRLDPLQETQLHTVNVLLAEARSAYQLEQLGNEIWLVRNDVPEHPIDYESWLGQPLTRMVDWIMKEEL